MEVSFLCVVFGRYCRVIATPESFYQSCFAGLQTAGRKVAADTATISYRIQIIRLTERA